MNFAKAYEGNECEYSKDAIERKRSRDCNPETFRFYLLPLSTSKGLSKHQGKIDFEEW